MLCPWLLQASSPPPRSQPSHDTDDISTLEDRDRRANLAGVWRPSTVKVPGSEAAVVLRLSQIEASVLIERETAEEGGEETSVTFEEGEDEEGEGEGGMSPESRE